MLSKDHFQGDRAGVWECRVILVYDDPVVFKGRKELRRSPLVIPVENPTSATEFAWGNASEGADLLAYSILTRVCGASRAAGCYREFSATMIRNLKPSWILTFQEIKGWLKLTPSQARKIVAYESIGFKVLGWSISKINIRQCVLSLRHNESRLEVEAFVRRDGTIASVQGSTQLLDDSDPLLVHRYPFVCFRDRVTKVFIDKVADDSIRVHLVVNDDLVWISKPYKSFHGAEQRARHFCNQFNSTASRSLPY